MSSVSNSLVPSIPSTFEAKLDLPVVDMSSQLLGAAEAGSLELVEQLLDQNADIDTFDEKKETPVIKAIRNNHFPVVSLLIDRGARKDTRATIAAVSVGSVEMLTLLLQNGFPVNTQVGGSKMTPLYCAVYVHQLELATILLDHRADPNLSTVTMTPLMLAAQTGLHKMCMLLLERGADPNRSVEAGLEKMTPLFKAVQGGNLDIVKLLIDRGAVVKLNNREYDVAGNPLHVAAAFGKINILDYFLYLGANVNLKNNHGETLLHVAADNAVVEYLLSKGADPMCIDHYGYPYSTEKPENTLYCELLDKLKLYAHRFSLLPRLDSLPEIKTLEGLSSCVALQNFATSFGNYANDDPLFSKVLQTFKLAEKSVEEQFASYAKGEMVIIPLSWPGHTHYVVIKDKEMIRCNRGFGSSLIKKGRFKGYVKGIRHYKLEKNFNLDLLRKICSTSQKMFKYVLSLLGPKEIAYIPKKKQKGGFCSWTSAKTALHASLYLEAGDHKRAKKLYKRFTKFDRGIALKIFQSEAFLKQFKHKDLQNRQRTILLKIVNALAQSLILKYT